MNSLIARYHPRTLWVQTLLLLIGITALYVTTTEFVKKWFYKRMMP